MSPEENNLYRHHAKWVLPVLALGLILVGGFVLNRLDNEQVNSGVYAPLSAGSNSWQAQLVRRGRSLQRDRVRQVWPFSAMRGPAEFMPQQLRRAAKATLGEGQQQLGLRFDGAQYVDTALGIRIWVVRGRVVTCIFHARTSVAACSTDAEVGHRGLVLVAGEDPSPSPRAFPTRFLALGIAPDWARAVRLQIVGGASKTVRVMDNTFALRARAPINVEKLIR